jgi:hypothetical protein
MKPACWFLLELLSFSLPYGNNPAFLFQTHQLHTAEPMCDKPNASGRQHQVSAALHQCLPKRE